MYKSPRFVLIGNPENRRASFFQQALQQAGQEPALVISYLDMLDNADLLNKLTGNLPADDIIVRIESPGENFEVEKRILALGGLEDALDLEDQRGRIYHPRLWFKGFTCLMTSVAKQFEQDWQGRRGGQGGQLSWFNHPADIVSMFDKPACKKILQPYTLPVFPVFSCYEEFFSFVREQQYCRFFIKLNSSSSASGVVAYEYNKTNGRELAYSTVEVVSGMDGDRYFNSLKVKKYTSTGMIGNVLDFLFEQGALVERWIPKARHEDSSYDLRIMGIGGQRRHAIARLSRGPMTNLHLGNQRCAVDELELSSATWAEIDTLVGQCMQAFPRSLYAGLDVLIPRDGGLPVLLEANAFGDLLPNLLHHGESTYLAEINAVLKRQKEAYACH
ncbi:STM4014 family protein [Undibacterium sp. TS12]|uniref:STM4014 family protein n=1 Tax=Undibacterium sp. TS12 TaxID=2908202 RepID=UPI001F4CA312|nr:STM4014 family protein [Undibacterium sp. TS12]MCH8621209.1 STM4014 family protein [Undibacterium sp. TS12]